MPPACIPWRYRTRRISGTIPMPRICISSEDTEAIVLHCECFRQIPDRESVLTTCNWLRNPERWATICRPLLNGLAFERLYRDLPRGRRQELRRRHPAFADGRGPAHRSFNRIQGHRLELDALSARQPILERKFAFAPGFRNQALAASPIPEHHLRALVLEYPNPE